MLQVAYNDDTAFTVTILLYSESEVSPGGHNLYMYSTHHHLINFNSESFQLRKDAGADGHFEEVVYSGAVNKMPDGSIQITVPAGLVPDISSKRVWAYSQSSRDRIGDLFLTQ